MRFLVTLNLKERQKIDDLKLFENWSGFKIIWKNLSFENYLKIKVLKIRFENWSFENYSKFRVFKITWKLEFC